MTPRRLLAQLTAVRLPDVFNPYVDRCDVHDRHDAARLRRRNLHRALEGALAIGVDTVWIARDLGYRGGRRTGLALTDEQHLEAARRLYRCAPLVQTTRGPAVVERTATVVWELLEQLQQPVFLWNVFPFHPHAPGDAMTNRSHRRAEAALARPVLDELLTLLQPRRVIAVGRDAQRALDDCGRPVIGVRHPSYGGVREFREGVLRAHAT